MNFMNIQSEQLSHIRNKLTSLDLRLAELVPHTIFDLTYTTYLVMERTAYPEFFVHDLGLVNQLTSAAFQEATQGYLDARTLQTLRRFLCASTLSHTGWIDRPGPHHLSRTTLRVMSYICGADLIDFLDSLLAPRNLSRYSMETIQVLYLVVFGTILGLRYVTQLNVSNEVSSLLLGTDGAGGPKLWWSTKGRLAQTLAHHLAVLASTLGFMPPPIHEIQPVEEATRMRTRSGEFIWAQRMSVTQGIFVNDARNDQPRSLPTASLAPNTPSSIFVVPCPDVLRGPVPASVATASRPELRFSEDYKEESRRYGQPEQKSIEAVPGQFAVRRAPLSSHTGCTLTWLTYKVFHARARDGGARC